MVRLLLLSALAMCVVVACSKGPAPTGSLSGDQKREVQALIRQELESNPQLVRAALNELEKRDKALLRASIEGDKRDFSVGPADAKVTIVEYFDYRCPYCHSAMDWALDTIRRNPKRVRFVFKEFPVLGPDSVEAARAALALKAQGKYLQFHEAAMKHRGPLGSRQIDELARSVGGDVVRMRRDMEKRDLLEHLRSNVASAEESNVTGTPSFLINGQWVNGWNEAEANRLLQEALRGGA